MIFMTDMWGEEEGYGHGGDFPGFHAIMWMLPAQKVGVYIALMAERPSPAVMEMILGSERMTPNPDHPVGVPITLLLLTGWLAFAWKKPKVAVEKWSRRFAFALPVVVIAIPLSLLVAYPEGESVSTHLVLGDYSRYIIASTLTNLLLLMALLQSWWAWKSWRIPLWGSGARGVLSRIHLGVTATAALLAVVGYGFYNFVGFNLP